MAGLAKKLISPCSGVKCKEPIKKEAHKTERSVAVATFVAMAKLVAMQASLKS